MAKDNSITGETRLKSGWIESTTKKIAALRRMVKELAGLVSDSNRLVRNLTIFIGSVVVLGVTVSWAIGLI